MIIDIDVEKSIHHFWNDVKSLIIDSNPCFEKLLEAIDSSMFNRFELSSVGIAIAHANYRRRTGKTMDLSIWIN